MPQSKNMARLSEDMKRELIAIIGGMKRPPRAGLPDGDARGGRAGSVHGQGAREQDGRRGKRNGRSRGRAEPRRGPCAQRDRKSACTSAKAPEFRFVADDGAKYAAHINELIAGLEQGRALTRSAGLSPKAMNEESL